jgi:hypothetical protein
MAETPGSLASWWSSSSHSQPRHVISKVPIYRIDLGFKHKLWSPNSFGVRTVLFGPWLWVRLAVDQEKLYFGIYES